MRVAHEETFGPLAPIFRFASEQQAIEYANDTEFGLAAYFFTRDNARIWRVSEALEFGVIGVNTGNTSYEGAPFGGLKASGIGREGSRHGIDEFLETKYVCVAGVDTLMKISNRDYVNALARGLEVIRAFTRSTPSMTLADMARTTGMNRATVRRFLLTLVAEGYAHDRRQTVRAQAQGARARLRGALVDEVSRRGAACGRAVSRKSSANPASRRSSTAKTSSTSRPRPRRAG